MATDNKYKYTRAYYKIKDLILNNPQETVFVICGGQGASKTISILQLVIQSLLSSEKEASVLSSELSKMKRTVIRDYKKISVDWGVMLYETDYNKQDSKHEYPNRSYIDFLGADTSSVGKGFRRDILYINEADKLGIETAIQFISRAKITIIDYNPDSLFWGDEFINNNNFLRLTYLDNECLNQSELKSILEYKEKGFHNPDLPIEKLFDASNIKSKYWANRWRVYGLGLVGALEGVVFDNWSEIQSISKESAYLGSGLDFGYTNDPSALVDFYRYNNQIIVDLAFYETGMSNRAIANKSRMLPNGQKRIIFADSAEPKSIDEIKLYGVNIKPAKKGRDSINFGISILQQDDFFVTKNSQPLQTELKKYTYMKDREGNTMNVPIDAYNHAIDAMRYFAIMRLNKRGKPSISIVSGS